MSAMSDPRTAVTYRIPAADLHAGDLVDTAANGNEWQQVLGVYISPGEVPSRAEDAEALRGLITSAGGRYVVVQLTDIAAIDAGVYFEDGVAMAAGEDEDHAMADVLSSEDGVRTYVYTKFELVTVRSAG
jgi:hypothetical protein